MPLSEQEQRCVDLTCQWLADTLGGRWELQTNLDELYPSEPSPECIVSNGHASAAIEVKLLSDDSVVQAYKEALLGNQKFLAPSSGGYFSLNGPTDLRLPIDLKLRRILKKEIERVAHSMASGDISPILVPRQGHIALASDLVPSSIHCLHETDYTDLLQPIVSRISGRFMLVDEGLKHSFFTEPGKARLHDTVSAACQNRLNGQTGPFTWFEEWELTKLQEPDEGEPGVWIIAVTEARDVFSSTAESVFTVLEKALVKFSNRRWADFHVIVLDNSLSTSHRSAAERLLGSLEPNDVTGIDILVLADGGAISSTYPSSPPTVIPFE